MAGKPESPRFPTDRSDLKKVLDELGRDRLPGTLAIEIVTLGDGAAIMRCPIETRHLASNGYLHAASIVALADTAAGYGCIANLPVEAVGFTTLELKSNHLGTQLDGHMRAEAALRHGGRSTQVWDVTVIGEETGRTLALFRCTQMILYPRPGSES